MAFEVGGVEIYEWPWKPDGTVAVVDTETGLWDPQEQPAPDAPAVVIYSPGISQEDWGAETVVKPGVNEDVVPLVTGLDPTTMATLLTFFADELWLPGEAYDMASWQTNGIVGMDDLMMGSPQGIVSAALGGLWAFLGPLVLAFLGGLIMDWLSDKIGGSDGKSIYYRGKLVGRVTDDGQLIGAGLQGL